ncbi:hypothetical protein AVEN_212142-1 [Araneus ventricosus]|uniref:Uncharacterized protein n=1 Tax=Araneus ventricosus TaxID=182803 RepID=A0A4Y2MAD3_ARAVE|nr:hypothetical protein AVEN_212142-1 [Araneus ventricosus]
MVSSCFMTIPIMLAKLKNCCTNLSGKSGATNHIAQMWHLIWVSNTYLEQGSLHSNSDVKTVAKNWRNGQGRDFYLAKLVLRSDKCLNRFGDYVEK